MGLINRCPHVRISGIYGDEINHCGGYRLSCDDCGRLLDGTVSLAKPAPHIIRTPEELEALAQEDADTVVLASEAGAVRTVRALAAMHRLGSVWGLPAVVVASGAQVRAAREAMEQDNE